MRPIIRSKHSNRGSILITFTLMLPVLIGLVGLAIDGSMIYLVQATLQQAVDGATLGAGRLLGSSANTTEIATEFLKANFPAGYWGSHDLTPNITATTSGSTHTISVSATVTVPLLFMRILHYNESTVAASAVATRKDTRVELVLDRSGSMTANIGAMKTAAAGFVGQFTPGSDELGLIVFGGSGFVAYPPTVHLSTTGPNVHFADPVVGGGDNMLTMINNIQAGTDTASAEALWLAYQELKTANSIDNDPSRQNAIVFFTDGLPNGFTAWFNDPANNSLNAGNGCLYNPGTGAGSIIGWMAVTGGGPGIAFASPSSSRASGIYKLLPLDTTHTAQYWDGNVGRGTTVNDLIPVTGTPMTLCTNMGPGTNLSGLSRIPPQDYYGNSTSGAADPNSLLYTTYGTAYNPNQPTNGYQVALASWNAVDNAAKRILADTTMNIAIYCIGFTGNGGVDPVLLKRIANTQDSNAYNQSWQTGMYVPAGNSAELQNAFNKVASEVLRLAQ